MTGKPETSQPDRPSANFGFLCVHDEQLVRYGAEAERYVTSSSNTCLLKLRQFAELLARLAAANTGRYEGHAPFVNLVHRLYEDGFLPPRIAENFHCLRKAGNTANHRHDGGEDYQQSLTALKQARELGVWFHRTFGQNRGFKPERFALPLTPDEDTSVLHNEVKRARQHVLDEGRKRKSAEERAHWEARQRAVWERRAIEAEQQRIAIENRLQRLQAEAHAKPRADITRFRRIGGMVAQGADPNAANPSRQRQPRHGISGTVARRNYTVSEIRHLILNNDEALERSIMTLYKRKKFAAGEDFHLALRCYSTITEHEALSAELRVQARLMVVSRYATELAVAANRCHDYRDLERKGLYR